MSKQATGSIGLAKEKIVYKKKTSIGSSKRSRPLNKHKRRSWKPYRGQG